MSLVDGSNMVMPVGPAYGNGYGNDMNCGWWWMIFLWACMFGGGNFGWGNNGGQVQNDVSRGFDNLSLSNQISALSSQTANGFDGQATREQLSSIQSAITQGFASAEIAACGRAMNDQQNTFNAQMEVVNGMNNIAQLISNACAQNQLATCQLGNSILSQAAENRYQMAQNTRDIITNATANTQALLDRINQMELDNMKALNNAQASEIASLKTQISTQQQTQTLAADNAAQTLALLNRLAPTPVPAYVVPAPGTVSTSGT